MEKEIKNDLSSMTYDDKIVGVKVRRVSEKVEGDLKDSTRSINRLGFTIVEITSDSGHTGIGYASNGVGGSAVKAMIDDYISPKILRRSPFENETIWQEIYSYIRSVGRKGLSFHALSAVDIALWDLKAKILNMPLYKLFGGKKCLVPVYGSGGWTSYSDEELVEEMVSFVEQGYKAVKLKVGIEKGTNLRRDLKRVKMVRKALGDDIKIMLDANNCWDGATGAKFANMVKDQDILFMEEPCPADDIPGLIKYKKSTDVPLATGEHEYTKYGARDLLISDCVDVLQCDVVRTGGFSEMLKICAMAESFNIKIAPHGRENLHMHLAPAFSNFLSTEDLVMYDDITRKVFINAPQQKNGYLELSDLPGHGLLLNEDFINSHQEN